MYFIEESCGQRQIRRRCHWNQIQMHAGKQGHANQLGSLNKLVELRDCLEILEVFIFVQLYSCQNIYFVLERVLDNVYLCLTTLVFKLTDCSCMIHASTYCIHSGLITLFTQDPIFNDIYDTFKTYNQRVWRTPNGFSVLCSDLSLNTVFLSKKRVHQENPLF